MTRLLRTMVGALLGLSVAIAALVLRADEPAAPRANRVAPRFGPADRGRERGDRSGSEGSRERWRRARLYAAAAEHTLAIADYDALLGLDPSRAEAYDERGSQHFMLGDIAKSIDDFDAFIKLRPDEEQRHWKRGISYYYAKRYDDGRRQFEGYQTFDDNDVENAVWRYLCMARGTSVEAARSSILKIKRDTRVPMMEIHALYSGQAQPEDLMKAVHAGSPDPPALNARLFYAHLYLGLYYEVAGDAERAREHILAARDHKIDHYMWNVADVHARMMEAAR